MTDLYDFMGDQKIKVKVITARGKTEIRKVAASKVKQMQQHGRKRGYKPTVYSNDYALNLLTRDPWIYDIRNWPDGLITKEEVKRCFENDEWKTNSGHFNYVMHRCKERGGSFDKLWKAFKENMEKMFKQHLAWAEMGIAKYKELESDGRGMLYAQEKARAYRTLLNGGKPSLDGNERFRLASF